MLWIETGPFSRTKSMDFFESWMSQFIRSMRHALRNALFVPPKWLGSDGGPLTCCRCLRATTPEFQSEATRNARSHFRPSQFEVPIRSLLAVLLQIVRQQYREAKGVTRADGSEPVAEVADVNERVFVGPSPSRQLDFNLLRGEPFAQPNLGFLMRGIRPDRVRHAEEIVDVSVQYATRFEFLDGDGVHKHLSTCNRRERNGKDFIRTDNS